jgi:hypothetical protein
MVKIQRLFIFSKWLHKYVGLALLLVFLFMGGTGILINHPSLLSPWSVPASWLGESYQYVNWNRFSFRDSVLADDGGMYIAGKMGVWYSPGKDLAFKEMNRGLPNSFYLRDINTLLAVEFKGENRMFAGGRSGLFYLDQNADSWLPVKGVADVEIVDLLLTEGQIMAFGPHGCYVAAVSEEAPVFAQSAVQIESKGQWVPGYRILFELHSGKLFGLPGRLLVDAVALLLIFLCFSALYIWFVPWRKRRFKSPRKKNRWLSTLYSYHLSIGIWITLPLFLIAGSGAFIRPPLILFSSIIPIPLATLAGKTPEILRAAMSDDGDLVLATRDGWYKGSLTFIPPLQAVTPPVPVFGMGTTVLESLSDNQLLVGSFSGLYKWNVGDGTGVDLDGNIAPTKAGLMPGKVMAAAAIVRDGVFTGYADYKRGLRKLDNTPILNRPFPVEQLENRTSLYHFLFELHNGRFLRDTIGVWYILYVPLVGMALMLVVVTGTFDWLKRKKILFVTRKKESQQ